MTETSERSPAADRPLSRLIPHFPDDISIRCIAQVPRSSHPALVRVSRSWRFLLRSPFLFDVRSKLGASQTFLCINVRTTTDPSRWYLLDRHHRWSPGAFLPLPPPPLPTIGSACAALGPSLYLLGGSSGGIPSSAVQVFDARLNCWALGPRMGAAREFAAAEALGGQIYAVGGCLPPSDSWAEVLDPHGSGWATVPSPPHLREKWMHGSAILGGRLLAVADRGGVVFDPAEVEASWGPVPEPLNLGWRGRAAVVDGILYSYDFLGKIKGYDPVSDNWKPLEGLEKELTKFLCGASLANLGGLLCLVWEGKRRGATKEMEIECVGIEISRTSNGGLRGSIAWFESAVLAVPKGSSVAHCVALEV